MKAKLRFYSKEEIAIMKAAIRNGEKLTAAAKRLSKDFKRSEASLYVKLLGLAGKLGLKKTRKAAKVQSQKIKTVEKGVTLRNGFVFDFKPQRAEMFQDHVRIYF